MSSVLQLPSAVVNPHIRIAANSSAISFSIIDNIAVTCEKVLVFCVFILSLRGIYESFPVSTCVAFGSLVV